MIKFQLSSSPVICCVCILCKYDLKIANFLIPNCNRPKYPSPTLTNTHTSNKRWRQSTSTLICENLFELACHFPSVCVYLILSKVKYCNLFDVHVLRECYSKANEISNSFHHLFSTQLFSPYSIAINYIQFSKHGMKQIYIAYQHWYELWKSSSHLCRVCVSVRYECVCARNKCVFFFFVWRRLLFENDIKQNKPIITELH